MNWIIYFITILLTAITFNLIIHGIDDVGKLLKGIIFSTIIAIVLILILKKWFKSDLL